MSSEKSLSANGLRAPKGARPLRMRVGRGHGGKVRTGGRGENGQKSRSGGNKAPGFEGGQTPWYRQLPKYRGFKNHFRCEFTEVAVGSLERFEDGATVTPEDLWTAGLVRNLCLPIKILNNGTLTHKLNVQMHAFTAGAQAAIEQAGGSVEEI